MSSTKFPFPLGKDAYFPRKKGRRIIFAGVLVGNFPLFPIALGNKQVPCNPQKHSIYYINKYYIYTSFLLSHTLSLASLFIQMHGCYRDPLGNKERSQRSSLQNRAEGDDGLPISQTFVMPFPASPPASTALCLDVLTPHIPW
jgi:hypothetical protein